MADDKKDIFENTDDELKSLGFSDEEIASFKKQVQTILQDPMFSEAMTNGELSVTLTVDPQDLEELFGDYHDVALDLDFDWDAMTPEVRAAMQELYLSDFPPTLH